MHIIQNNKKIIILEKLKQRDQDLRDRPMQVFYLILKKISGQRKNKQDKCEKLQQAG